MRHDAIVEIARQCSVDRDIRKTYNAELRQWYTRGTSTGERSRFGNMIRSTVRQSAAYRFQSESVRFGLALSHRYGEQFSAKLEVARDDFHRAWHDDGDGLVIADGNEWASVYPSVIFKVVPVAGMARTTLVPDPADVGVFEADKPFDRQEALTHYFTLTLPSFRRLVSGHPDEERLMDLARMEANTGSGEGPLTGTTERIVFDQFASPTTSPVFGGGAVVNASTQPEAIVEAPRVLCCEVWVVDDRIQDWRVVTCLAAGGLPTDTVWDRRVPILSGIDPFVKLTLSGALDYVWGFSSVDDLTGLQDLFEERMGDINELMKLQLKPPTVLGGFGGLSDERAKRLNTPGGVLSTSIPNPSVNRFQPNMPPEAYSSAQEIKRMVADQAGLPILTNPGGGDSPGIRAGNQLGVLATLSSAWLREDAMKVERATSEVATLKWRMMRELSDEPLVEPNGDRFLLKHLPRDVVALVDSHSASPLYAAAVKAEADVMLKAGAIDLPDYVRMKDPPGRDVLIAKARHLAEAKAKQAERMFAIQEMKASRGRSR
jgi:hypothetical protein